MKYKGFEIRMTICKTGYSILWYGEYLGQTDTLDGSKTIINRLIDRSPKEYK